MDLRVFLSGTPISIFFNTSTAYQTRRTEIAIDEKKFKHKFFPITHLYMKSNAERSQDQIALFIPGRENFSISYQQRRSSQRYDRINQSID